MKNEIDPLISNYSWKLIKFPEGMKALYNKWVYQVKNKYNSNKQYKSRLVDKDMLTKGVTHDKLRLCTTSVGFLV